MIIDIIVFKLLNESSLFYYFFLIYNVCPQDGAVSEIIQLLGAKMILICHWGTCMTADSHLISLFLLLAGHTLIK